jgi:hypothetical protein
MLFILPTAAVYNVVGHVDKWALKPKVLVPVDQVVRTRIPWELEP